MSQISELKKRLSKKHMEYLEFKEKEDYQRRKAIYFEQKYLQEKKKMDYIIEKIEEIKQRKIETTEEREKILMDRLKQSNIVYSKVAGSMFFLALIIIILFFLK